MSQIISIRIVAGSCGQILDSKSGKLFVIKEDIIDTDYYYSGQMSTCSTLKNTVVCPKGTFVKQIEWNRESNLTDGIKLSCMKPASNSSSQELFSHPKSASHFTEKRWCGAFKEFTSARNVTMDINNDLLIGYCKAENETKIDEKLKCQDLTAVSGMTFAIESESKYYIQEL